MLKRSNSKYNWYWNATIFLKDHILITIFVPLVISIAIGYYISKSSTEQTMFSDQENTARIIEEIRSIDMRGPGLEKFAETDTVEINNNKLLIVAENLLADSKYNSAFSIYDEILRSNYFNKNARFYQIVILAEYLNDITTALDKSREYIRDFPKDPDGYYQLAVIYEKIGDIKAANSNYKFCLERSPTHLMALQNFSNNVMKLNQIEEGILYHEKALDYNSEFYPSIAWLGSASFKLGDYQKAKEYFNKWFTNIDIGEDDKGVIKGMNFDAETLQFGIIVDEKLVEKVELIGIDFWNNKVNLKITLKR